MLASSFSVAARHGSLQICRSVWDGDGVEAVTRTTFGYIILRIDGAAAGDGWPWPRARRELSSAGGVDPGGGTLYRVAEAQKGR